MGSRGPVPKRTDQLHGHRSKEELAAVTKIIDPAPICESPAPDPDWHPVAMAWFDSLASSGQRIFYQPSDWATAVLIAESMSRDLGEQVVGVTPSGEILRDTIPLKGASLSAYLKAMGGLMVTEGDRRRAAVELQKAQATDPDAERAAGTVTDLRSRLAGA
jgi:hypothetical protein